MATKTFHSKETVLCSSCGNPFHGLTPCVAQFQACPICQQDFAHCDHTFQDVRNFRAGKPVGLTMPETIAKAHRRALAEKIMATIEMSPGMKPEGNRFSERMETRRQVREAIERVLEEESNAK